jgi:hypothetical protein
MKTWSRADLIGFLLTVSGVAAFVFSNSKLLVSIFLRKFSEAQAQISLQQPLHSVSYSTSGQKLSEVQEQT